MAANNLFRKRVLLALRICRAACIAVSAIAVRAEEIGGLSFSRATNLWFLSYFAATFLLRFLFEPRGFEARALAVLDFFAVLLYGYFDPHFLFFEYLMLPVQLFEISALYPAAWGIPLILCLGVPGSVLLSYAKYSSMTLAILQRQYPVSVLSIPYYCQITLISVIMIVQTTHMEKADSKMLGLQTLNSQLDKINRDITAKMFRLKRDSIIEERKRITKEIHDMAGYIFINLIMMLQAASAILYKDTKKAESLINDARDYASRGIEEIRQILRGMRATSSAPLSLQNELFDVAESFQKATEVSLSLQFGNWPKTFSRELDLFFTSFMQEGLTNSLKHGHAKEIEVRCWITPGEVMMSISDDGKGAATPIRKGIGLSGIEDFVAALQGSVNIQTDEAGFKIAVTLPTKNVVNPENAVETAGPG